ncbi:MAG: hypothetical protein LAO20_12030 [Acidobacteriia bacterium]|nr:hypothetical protein [Terriglobia bacterium]
MENRSPLLTAHYAEKAYDFLQGMKLLAEYDLAVHRASIGLLATHSAIALNDAILTSVRGKSSKAEDHSEAARELERVCSELKIEKRHGVRHLSSLLKKKNLIAYGDQRIEDNDVKSAIDQAERFANWAYIHFKEVLGARES